MNLSAPFILRPVMTTLLTLTLLVLGINAYYKMPVSNLPDVNFPTITVTVPFPGTNPTTMANTVATPLEKQFMAIPGIRYVTSSNTLGSTNIVLEFDTDKDIDLAAVDVNSAIIAATPNLPPNLPQQPTYKKVNPSSTPIVYIAVTSPTLTQGELYDYASTFVGQRISMISGVAQVMTYGSPKAVRIQVDPAKATSLNLTLDEIATAISNANQYQSLGQFDGNHAAPLIYDSGALLKAVNYEPLIIAYRNGAPIRLSDTATAIDSLQADRSVRRYISGNIDQPNVTLAVQGQPGANAVQIADALHALLPALQAQLPGSLELFTVFDRSESIRASVHEVELTIVIAFILVVLVIFLYLGKVRETAIPAVIMPLSIIATFAVIYPLGFTIDTLSLLALTLAIGFIIDDAIVVLENIVRLVENGATPLQAALDGSKQIGFTIASMTLSLIAVFIPLIFMAGIIGKLFREFAITLTIVTLISGIISLTLTPMLCSLFIPPHNAKEHNNGIQRFSNGLNFWMAFYYRRCLLWVINHRLLALAVGIGSVILSGYLFTVLPNDFIPNEDIGFIMAYTEAAQGTSSEQMNIYQQQVVNTLRSEPEIASLVSISANPQYRQGILFIRLISSKKREAITSIVQRYTAKLSRIPGVNVYMKIVPVIDLNVGSQVRGSYQYLIQSLDTDELYKSAEALLDKMREDPLFQGISTDLEIKTPQIDVEIERNRAYTLGLDIAAIERTLSLAYSGNRVSRIQTPINQYDVIVELDRSLQRTPSSLDLLYVRPSPNNNSLATNSIANTTQIPPLVPLNAVVSVKDSVGPASVNHFAQFPAVTITFNIPHGVPLGTALKRLDELAQLTFTPEVSGSVKGAAESFQASVRSISILLVVTVFTIYVVLGILYESFIHPLTILSTLPPAILGALLTLYFIGEPLSLYAYLGIILLIGIVKKNGIMIVDFALENIRNKGETAKESIIEASLVRFRPIMMTTVAAIMGAVPIAMGIGDGSAARRPLGYVIIGGMLVSQLITLFLTPIIYLYLEQMRERWQVTAPVNEEASSN
jgi:HAE1 family hydrophobic/amphiphilic exporter-1